MSAAVVVRNIATIFIYHSKCISLFSLSPQITVKQEPLSTSVPSFPEHLLHEHSYCIVPQDHRLQGSSFKHTSVSNSVIKAILCISPNCRSVVVLQAFENPDNFVISRIADDVVLPGKQVLFTFLNKLPIF